jgi:hypothetical protein
MKRGKIIRRTVKHYPWGEIEIVVKRYDKRKRKATKKRLIKTPA